jgi:hypothetical protein
MASLSPYKVWDSAFEVNLYSASAGSPRILLTDQPVWGQISLRQTEVEFAMWSQC